MANPIHDIQSAALADQQAHAFLAVSGTDIFALGHYPGNPIYPGVLVAERLCALAQRLALPLLGGSAAVVSIKRIQYLDAIVPGDVAELTASIKKQAAGEIEIAAIARVGETIKTRATIICRSGVLPLCDGAPSLSEKPKQGHNITHRALPGILPHRYPFLLLDTIDDYVPGESLQARKVVNRASPLFLGQQPQSYPHSLVIESIGQAGIALYFLSRGDAHPVDIVLGSFSDAQFLADVPFDSVLSVQARIERQLDNGVVLSGTARVGTQTVVSVASLVAMIDPR
jgi:3-hydroxymyristoyl/3-hydroxydecanoyl-(acyl carrier protein) dehydratase